MLDSPDTDDKFRNCIYASDDTLGLLRAELKARLIKESQQLREMRELATAIDSAEDEVAGHEEARQSRWYGVKLLGRIARKLVSRRRRRAEKPLGIVDSDSLRQVTLQLGEAGERILDLCNQLSSLNPTQKPALGFANFGGVPPSDSSLDGEWKLIFTTASDASFPETEKRGVATASQVVDAEAGTFTNVVDFERGKLKGFRVVVDGAPLNDTDVGLSFRGVRLLRRSRFPRLFGDIYLRLPSGLIRRLSRASKSKGPYLRLKYIDDTMRIHVSDTGNYFVHTRVD